MLDLSYFEKLQSDINEIKEKLSDITKIAHPEKEYYDIKAIAEISGIPYNTLLNKKELLPDKKLGFKIGVKLYYHKDVVFGWLKTLKQ